MIIFAFHKTDSMAGLYNEISLPELAAMTGLTESDTLSRDFMITHVSGRRLTDFLRYPARLNAYAAIYCMRGDFSVDINVKTIHVSEHTMMFYVPGSIVKVNKNTANDGEAVLVAASANFIQGIPVNFNGLFEKSLELLDHPCITIDEEGQLILKDYYTLVSDMCQSDLTDKADAIKFIGSSLLCLLGNLWTRALSRPGLQAKGLPTRTNMIFEHFLKLVAENFMTHKTIGFYADQLYLTPKYLSGLVKTVSGRTASEWIDSFIVLEAKNLLKYSNLTVKEIGYKLHFASIPSFFKFFKSHTGKTPTEYRYGTEGDI